MAEHIDPSVACPNCGQEVEAGALVCPHCHGPLPMATAEEDLCPYCGAETVHGHCRVCGLLQPESSPVASARRWTVLTVVLAVIALLGSAWLTQPWAELPDTPTPAPRTRYANLPQPSATPTATPTWTATATPTSTPTVTPTPTPEFIIYTVQRGDSASVVAQRFGITTAELLEANNLSPNDILSLGQELRIPTGPGVPEPTAEATETAGLTPTQVPATANPSPTPPPASAQTPSATRTPVIHVVKEGEHLGIIAPMYGLDQATVARANGISVSDILQIGQELIIPIEDANEEGEGGPSREEELVAPLVHVVEQGDVLGRIALRYGVTVEELVAANGISETTVLRVGQELVIPISNAQPEETPAPTETANPSPTPSPTPGAVASALSSLPAPSTPSPTLTPAARQFAFGRPNLLSPTNGSRIEGGAEADVVLSWTSVGLLSQNEWYQLTVWRPTVDEGEIVVWTKATSWRMPATMYPSEGEPRVFWWQVTVVERSMTAVRPTVLSAGSQVYRFTWV